jgi:cell division protein FtsB
MFDNPFSMVVAIVAMAMIAGVLKARYKAQNGIIEDENGRQSVATRGENEALKAEITALKERIIVLERLATDNNSAIALDREIEKLR